MQYSTVSIQKALERFPNARLSLPTPIHRLSRLSAHLGCNIYTMREDLTGFALGGNKNRKLDYLIGDALHKKSTALLASNANSFTRNAAAAGRVHGLEVHVVLAGDDSDQNAASQVVFQQFEAILHYVPFRSVLLKSVSHLGAEKRIGPTTSRNLPTGKRLGFFPDAEHARTCRNIVQRVRRRMMEGAVRKEA